jgi:hypothetical protein
MSKDMQWHKKELVNDGKMHHPADSKAWKHVDSEFKWFSEEGGCNVRLGLASDGFNPFGMQSLTYSIWPVILVPYNLPPWLCQKQSNWILSMLIHGSKSIGMDIDVYLRPLILELKSFGIMVLKQEMQGLRRILICVLYFFGQLMTSQPMLCYLVGALKESLHVHTTTNILSICG